MASAGGSYQESSSKPMAISPFGGLPFQLAKGTRYQFSQPLQQGFGYGKGKGPLAGFINQATGPLQSFLPQMQQTGSQITPRPPSLLMEAISNL